MEISPAQVKAHRFRTQLATIVSSVELLLHYGGAYPDTDRNEMIREIGHAAQRMREMLDEAAVEAGRG